MYKLFGFWPVPIIKVKKLPWGFDGLSLGLVVLIIKDTPGMIQHEMNHTKQFICSFGISGLLYIFSKKHRLEQEIDAYLCNYRAGEMSIDLIAKEIHERYDTGYSKNDITKLLLQAISYR